MQTIKRFVVPALALAVLTSPAQAMPEDVAEMRQIIAGEFGGNANAYVEEEAKDFRRMACRQRNDLLKTLLEDGLELDRLTYKTHVDAAYCAYQKEAGPTLRLILTPDLMTQWEESTFGQKYTMSPFQGAIYANEYDLVKVFLENGVHQAFNDKELAVLTREEQLLLVVNWANDAGKEQAIRAFHDAGFSHIVAAAQNEANIRYVRARLGKEGGGGGLLRTIAGGVAGAYLGGTTGAALGILKGGTSGSDNEAEIDPTRPLPLATNRAELGMMLGPVTLPKPGLEVQEIAVDGPASFTDIAKGDIIVAIGGMPVARRGSLYVATEKVNDAEQFEVDYIRDGERRTAIFGLAQPEPALVELQAQPATSASSSNVSSEDTTLAELERLADLRDRGVLSDEEFAAMKARILGADTKATESTSGPLESTPISEAFGVRMGQPIADLSIVKQHPNGRYKVSSPVSDPDLDSLVVRATPETGVCAVEMFGATYENDRRGQAVLAAYNRQRQELDRLYGAGEETDVLRKNSEAADADDYAQSFWLGHRVKSSVWRIDGAQGTRSVYLDVFASGPYDLYLKVSHTFSNFNRCQSIIEAQSTEDS